MAVYVVGYFAWHASGHRPLFFVGPGTQHLGSTLAYLAAHAVAGPVETLALASETALAGLLGTGTDRFRSSCGNATYAFVSRR